MNLSVADQVLNRAAMRAGGDAPGPGDQALASLLLFHGLAMTGGIHHAIDSVSSEELLAAINGFSYFGLKEMAEWLQSASSDPLLKEWTEDTETSAIFRYSKLIPSDAYLAERFEAIYLDRPPEFAALL